MQFNDLKLRARALFKPGKVERELDDELAFHIACETRRLEQRRADQQTKNRAAVTAASRFRLTAVAARGVPSAWGAMRR